MDVSEGATEGGAAAGPSSSPVNVTEDVRQGSNTRRIVILGKTGIGKSSLANTIFGEELFTISDDFSSETAECQANTKSVNGRSITLIDTPGFFDTHRSEEELTREIVRCITECALGPHAFLIVLKVEKFTEHEQGVIAKINDCFSEEVFKYAIVLFTHGDQIPEGQTIQDLVCKNQLVSDLVKKCGDRCHVIDNKYWKNNQQDEYRSNQFQVKELLKTIDKIIEANKGSCYTNEVLQAVEEEIQEEEEHIRQSPGNMTEEEIREKAKVSIFMRLLIRLAGIATGALLGAFFGVVVSVGIVLTQGQDTARIAAGAAGTGLNPLVVTSAAAGIGALTGGVAGYDASEGAETLQEAAKGASEAVTDGALFVLDKAHDVLERLSKLKQPKPK